MRNASPFRRTIALDALNALSRGTAMEPLGIAFTEIGPDYLRGTMPVDARTRQPYGLLHGGALRGVFRIFCRFTGCGYCFRLGY